MFILKAKTLIIHIELQENCSEALPTVTANKSSAKVRKEHREHKREGPRREAKLQ